MQCGENQVAAAYALYSSATMLVVSLGRGTFGFTLDRQSQEFVLTHPSITIPQRGAAPCMLPIQGLLVAVSSFTDARQCSSI